MAITNLSNYELMIRDYIVSRIQEEYPSISFSSNSLINDEVVNPIIPILSPLLSLLRVIDYNQNLANYELISEDDLDTSGEGNYFITRNPGVKASGYVYIEFKNIPTGADIMIPASTSVAKDDTYKYITTVNTTITNPSLAQYYNSTRLVYVIPVLVEAEEVGSDYNAEANQITILNSTLRYATGTVYNATAFTNGTDKETNESYYDRMKSIYISRTLGTDPGYERDIADNFPAVEDLVVVGYRDPLMRRDVYETVNGMEHIGGKVDIYIKGTELTTHIDSFKVNSKVYYFKQTPIVESSVLVSNITSPSSIPVFTIEYDDLANKGTSAEKSKIVVTDGASIDDELRVDYYYLNSEGMQVSTAEYFYYKSYKTKLNNKPFYEVTNVINLSQVGKLDSEENPLEATDVVISDTYYSDSYISEDTKQTVDEDCVITFSNNPGNTTIVKPDGTFFPRYNTDLTVSLEEVTPGAAGAAAVYSLHILTSNTAVGTITLAFDDSAVTQAVNIPLAATETITTIATKVAEAFVANAAINAAYIVTSSAADVSITKRAVGVVTLTVGLTDNSTTDTLEITYTCNSLISDIQNRYDQENYRVVTADILARIANKAYVYVAMSIQPKLGYTIGTAEKAYISSIVANYVNTQKFVTSLSADVLIQILRDDARISTFVDYISLPITFYSIAKAEDAIASLRPEEFTITVTSGAARTGNVILTLNNTDITIAVTANDSTAVVAGLIQAAVNPLADYIATVDGSVVSVTGTVNRTEHDPYIDYGITGVRTSIVVTVPGIGSLTNSNIVFDRTYYPRLQLCEVTQLT